MLTQVTTNQVVLFHSLIEKYRRQFNKHELYPEQLVNLPWDVKVVDSSPKYTNGHIEIVDDMIYFKCPFSRKFIETFRKEPNNNFYFNKDERRYEAPYNQYSLKILIKVADKYFKNIDMCNVTQELLHDVEQYNDVKYWEPTLVKLNGRLYIVGMNSALNDALGDLELNDDLQTLSNIASYGIKIHESLYDKNVLEEKIAANYNCEVETSHMTELIQTLKMLECNLVYLSGGGSLNNVRKVLIEICNQYNLRLSRDNFLTSPMTDVKNPVMIKVGNTFNPKPTYKVTKLIRIVNSQPIDIK
jgi:hypothetical protein